jgi:adenylate cyclase
MADEGFKRKLTAILSADVEGYSRLMDDDEAATVRTLTSYRSAITDLVQQFSGRVVDSPGDNILAEFTSVVDAVNCAVEIQRELAERNADLPDERKMQFRIGVNLGDVIDEEERIYGDGVNIAARIESLSEAGGICISHSAYDQIKNKLKFGYEYLGDHQVKNINDPVRVYKVLMGPEDAGKLIGKDARHSTKRWFVPAAVVAAIVTTSIAWYLIQNITRSDIEPASTENMTYALPDKPSIAVLPFNDFSKESGQEYIADGITENIITTLSKTDKLFVIARNSTFKYKNQSVSIKEVSESLGVKYVLEGSVQIVNNRIRITAQLIDAIKGSHIWAQKYDKNVGDLFQIQDEIALKILEALRVKLTEGERALLIGGDTKNLEAYLMFLKGLEHSAKFNEKDNILARKAGQAAIEIDPKYPSAYRLLALTYLMDIWLGTSEDPKATIKKAFNLLEKVRSLDANSPGYYYLMGQLLLLTRQHDKAIKAAERAVSLSPNNSVFIFGLATIFRYNGEPDKALNLNKKVMRLNPYPESAYYVGLGYSYLSNDKYEESIEAFKKAISVSPDQYLSYRGLAVAYSQLGFEKEAKAAMSQTLKLRPQFSIEWIKRLPYRHKEDLNNEIARMEKAGFPKHPPLPLPDKPSIAVLAFDNLSGDPEQEYFADGISEEIITALSKTPKLFVIARTSSFKYKGKEVDIRTVGRELGVRYVLEGSVRKAGDKIRITAQLINAITEKHLWAERYERNLREIFAIQDEITLAIIKAMQVELTKGEMADLTGRGTKNLDAYLKALQAQEQWWRMNKQSTLKAKQLALEAITIDGQYGYPYAIVSWSHMMDVWLQSSVSPKESMQLAVEAIQKALTLDEFDYRIHIVLSSLYVMQGKNDKAIFSAERALELCPGGAFAHAVMGTALRYACRFDESVKFREQAITLDPFPTAMGYRNLALAYSRVGRYDDAIAEYKKALHTNPNDWVVHFGMIEANAKLNRKEEARIATKELLRIRPDFLLDWLAETTVPMYAKECRSKISDDIEFLRAADVGLQ